MSKYNSVSYNLIYIFSIDDEAHKGKLKIGKTSFYSLNSIAQLTPNCPTLQQAAHQCIMGETHRAMIEYTLEYCELAVKNVTMRDGSIQQQAFWDHDVKAVLLNSNYSYVTFNDTGRLSEWFIGDLETAKLAIKAVKEGKDRITNINNVIEPVNPRKTITLRKEQEENVVKTMGIFKANDTMLWDCKMRYGKTVTAYELIRRMNEKGLFKKVIVITHRPAVQDGWGEDHELIFKGTNHKFIDKTNGKVEFNGVLDEQNDIKLNNTIESGVPFVYFASIQDLRGSAVVGGKYIKNRAVFNANWDLIIIDEAHEGTQTDLGDAVITNLKKKNTKTLSLSGTPYNIMGDFQENKYTWTYVDEQKAKKQWDIDHPNEKNPYEELPTMNIFTFDLTEQIPESYRYVTEDSAFNFREFFRTWTGDKEKDYKDIPAGKSIGDFVHDDDVYNFLSLISKDDANSNYPFSTNEFRDMFCHTFWMVPGVASAKALSTMLNNHPRFKDEYHVVNIAGEGDEEQPYDEALALVKSSIKAYPKTITISCGKLNTGVTVREWTGVMMLSGSSSTAASGYMQTIFRVQSPGFINGKQKTNCYVFDFAPDRTLKVIADVHSLRHKRGAGDDENSKIILGEFLNFCPVIAIEGTVMRTYDVPEMMRQIKKISIEAAINNGFDDDTIYKSDAGLVVDKFDAAILKKLSNVVVPQKKGKKQSTVVISEHGLTDEERKRAEDAEKKKRKKKPLTPEEEAALEKLKKQREEQRKMFDLLRAVSIRLPLLFYGADADITEIIHLKDFVQLVDDESWEEFMPRGLKKNLFLDILRYYDEDVVTSAGLRIRKLAKAADELPPTLRAKRIVEILSKFKNPDKETVLTPWRVVNMHLGDTIGGYNFYDEKYDKELDVPRLVEQGDITSDILLNTKAKILELNSKSGLYPLYMTYSIYMMNVDGDERTFPLDKAQEIWFNTLDKNIFVLCKTKMARTITIRTLAGYSGKNVNAIYLTKLIDERMKDIPRLANKLKNPMTWGKDGDGKMKFDAVVGNPPYQDSTSVNNRSGAVYPYFYDTAEQLSDFYSLISPARFLFNAGLTPKEWNAKMLLDPHIKVARYEQDATRIFPNTEIKGGIAILVRNEKEYFGAIDTFIPNEELRKLLMHFTKDELNNFTSIMYGGRSDLKFNDVFLNDYPSSKADRLKAIQISHPNVKALGPNEEYELKSPTLEVLSYAFESDNPQNESEYYKILGLVNGKRCYRWINRKYMTPRYPLHNNIEGYKLFIPKASGNGIYGEALGQLVIAGPGESATPTFISIGNFSTRNEAENAYKYINTKFARALLGALKITQDIVPSKWAYVPIQNFSDNSDIDWAKSISDIDKQLYKKYGLSSDEMDFIETHVKSMDPNVKSEYETLIDKPYFEVVEELLSKYGKAKHNYFKDMDCTIKNTAVSRTDEGLYCHHIDEDKAIMLSNKEYASRNPFEYQKKDRLVYCNLLEHLILHVKIAENPSESANAGELPGIGGAINFICKELNDIYSGKEFVDEWRKNVADAVKNDFDDYISVLKYLWNVIEKNAIYKEIITKKSLCLDSSNEVVTVVMNALNDVYESPDEE